MKVSVRGMIGHGASPFAGSDATMRGMSHAVGATGYHPGGMRLRLATICAALALAGCAGSGSMDPSGGGGTAAAGRGGTTGGGGTSAGRGGNGGPTGGTGGAGATAGTGGDATGTAGTTGAAGVAGTVGGGGTGVGGNAGATGGGGTAAGGSGGAGGSTGAAGTGSGGRGGGGGASTGRGGGAGTASGGAGASGGTGGTGGAANPCSTRAGLRFCETFESKTVGAFTAAAPWALQAGAGAITIDGTTPAHSGTKSVKVHATDNDFDTLFVLHDATILPAPSGRFFLRAYMRLSRAMSGGHNSYIIADPFAMQGTGNNVRIGEMNAMLMYTIMGDGHGALSNQNFYNDGKPGVVFAPSTWVCLEVLLDRGKPEIDVWVDGTEVPDLHHTDWALDNYDSIRFGFEKYAGPGIDIWYDDIAIGTERIGCQ